MTVGAPQALIVVGEGKIMYRNLDNAWTGLVAKEAADLWSKLASKAGWYHVMTVID